MPVPIGRDAEHPSPDGWALLQYCPDDETAAKVHLGLTEVRSMAKLGKRIVRALMLLTFCTLPSIIECDLDDGELDVDWDELEDLQIDLWWN